MVPRVGAVVERDRAPRQFAHPDGIRRVGGDQFDARTVWAAAPAGHHADPLAGVREQGGDARTDRSGADDDVQRHDSALRWQDESGAL